MPSGIDPPAQEHAHASRPPEVFLTEVGPRDGLQNEKRFIDTAVKIALVDRLSNAGCRLIEVGSFVSAAGVGEVAVFASASEGFSQRNINCSIAESLARFAPVLAAAQAAGVPVRGYVSCVTDCPYDGPIAPEAVAAVE